MRALASAVLMLFQAVPVALPPAGSLELDARAGRVTLRANRVPLNRILDRLARETGMKVTYESTPPSQAVTATLDHLEPRDAIVRLMEGLGVPYVFRTDVSGRRVDTLIVSDSGAGIRGASSASLGGGENIEYPADVVEDIATYEEPPPSEMPDVMPEVQIPQIPSGMPAPDLALPGFGQSGQAPAGYPNPQPGYPGQPTYPGPISNPYPN
jgi:hypothetical protein